jgi:hypothetical protein
MFTNRELEDGEDAEETRLVGNVSRSSKLFPK